MVSKYRYDRNVYKLYCVVPVVIIFFGEHSLNDYHDRLMCYFTMHKQKKCRKIH